MDAIPILYIIDKMTVGGTQRHISQIMSKISDRGFEPYLCCLQSTGQMAEDIDPARIFCLDLKRINSFTATFKIRRLIHFIQTKKIAIVHNYLFSSNIYGTTAAWLAGAKVNLSSRRGSPYGRSWKHLFALRIANRMVDKVIVNCEQLVQFTADKEHLSLDKICKIYNGIEAFKLDELIRKKTRQQLGILDHEIAVGMIAGFRPVKDHATAIHAAALLCSRFPDIRFIFVGDGQTRPEIEQLAKTKGVADRCIFTGVRNDVEALSQAFDIGILCSIEEGFSNAVLEIMMAEKPLVVTDISGNQEAIENGSNGFMFASGNTEKMAEHIATLVQDSNLRKEMGKRNRDKVITHYTLNVMIQKMSELYFSLLEQKQTV